MPWRRVWSALPYLVLLGASGVLYRLTDAIARTSRPGQLGPEVWPRMAIGLIAIVSLYEAIRRLVFHSPPPEVHGLANAFGTPGDASEASPPRSLPLLAGGVVLTLAYVTLVPILGFVTASFGFLVLFLYLGGLRQHRLVWSVSALGIIGIAFVFLRVVYVSLPRGQPPFSGITQGLTTLLGAQ